MTEAFPVSGNIEPVSFPHLLVDLHRHGATGSLKVSGPNKPGGPNYTKAVYLRGGRILFGASANDPRDQLGEILIESGRITRQQLDEVSARVGATNPLAKALQDGGFVNQREITDAARVKVERILADMLSRESGSFEFEDGVLPKGAVDLKLSTEKLLLAAVRRIPDRAFALRHVDLATVLEPVPEAEPALAEIRAEVWPLLERLDGRRTLRDAIALTRLDEFEAAKTACALLFLGVVRPRSAEPMLDLAQEAQSGFAIDEEPSYTVPMAAAEPIGFVMAEPEPAFEAVAAAPPAPEPLSPEPEPEPEPEPPVFSFEPVPDAPASEPTLPATFAFEPEPPAVEASPLPFAPEEPEPDASPRDEAAETVMFTAPADPAPAPETEDEEPMIVADAPHDLGPEEPTFIMPPPPRDAASEQRGPAPSRPTDEPPVMDSPAAGGGSGASRPSQEDLAALDAMLNPSGSGRAARAPETSPQERWEPQFRPASPAPVTPAPRRPASRVTPRASGHASRVPIIVAALAGVVLATIAAWYFFLRGPAEPVRTAAVPRPSPTAPLTTMPRVAATPVTETAADTPAPTPAATPAAAAPTPVPTSTPVPPASQAPAPTPTPRHETASSAAPTSAAGGSTATDARALLAQGALPDAARAFAASLAAGSRGRFSLQLLMACSPENVQKAVAAVPGRDLFILPVSHQGRPCYRVCWGVYDSRAAAEAGTGTVPAYFRQGAGKPRVSTLAELLP